MTIMELLFLVALTVLIVWAAWTGARARPGLGKRLFVRLVLLVFSPVFIWYGTDRRRWVRWFKRGGL